MARTLYLPDGSTECIFGNPEDELQKIIYERLGRDCEELYKEVLEELRFKNIDPEDYERIADGYYNALVDTMNTLHDILIQPRLSRNRLESLYHDLKRNL